MKHTPGPWRVGDRLQIRFEGGKHGYVEIGSDKSAFWIARVQGFSDDPGEYAANARLIAVSPSLLSFVVRQRDATLCICHLNKLLLTNQADIVPCTHCEAVSLIAAAEGYAAPVEAPTAEARP